MAESYRPTRSVEALRERPHDLSDPASIARELAGEAVEDAKGSVDRITAYTQALANRPGFVGDLVRFTRAKPLEALAVVAGIAFVAGALLKRGQSREVRPQVHSREVQTGE